MIALAHKQFLSRLVAFALAVFWPIENSRHAQHAHNREDLFHAAELFGLDDHFAQGRVERQFAHLPAEVGQVADIVQRSEHPELVLGFLDRLLRGGGGSMSSN